MPKTNDELYDDLIEQALLLTRTNEYEGSRERTKKLRETVYLMDAYQRGENVVQAKLAMTDDDVRGQQTIVRLRHHLGSLMDHGVFRLICGPLDLALRWTGEPSARARKPNRPRALTSHAGTSLAT